jgi:hypothetical protein
MSVLILHTNRWQTGTILTASSEAAQFSAEYTQDDSPQLFWRSAVINVEVTIDCDLGAALEYDFVALLGHNLTSAATIIVYGADDDAFSVNVVSDTLTFNGNNLYEILAAARTKRYVRVSLLNTANPSGYLQVGTVVVGKGNALNRGPAVPYQRGPLNETEVEYSPSANLFTIQERPSLDNRVFSFVGLNDASELIVEALLEACGSHVAWVLCLDSTAPNANSYWVHLKSQELPECQHVNYWNVALEIEEVL